MEYFAKYKPQLELKLEVHDMHSEYIGKFSMETLSVLTCLYFSDDGWAPSVRLKRLLKMTAPQMTRSAQVLIRAGLVYYTRCPDDHRGKFLCLTTLGFKLRDRYMDSAFNRTEETKKK